jgi:hypothetical protein
MVAPNNTAVKIDDFMVETPFGKRRSPKTNVSGDRRFETIA